MFVAIWEYEVRAGAEAAFEALYGPAGDWAKLFCEHPGYLDTELLRDTDHGHYVTIDRWQSAADYDAFLIAAKTRYAALDALGDALTVTERRIGRYQSC